MTLVLKAALLGIVEGLTEFLPISSTGHLIIAGELIAYPESGRATFEVFIQLGAILAVLWHYRGELLSLVFRTPADGLRLLWRLLLAFLPAAAVGVLLHEQIETHLFGVRTVAAALVAGGLFILWVERRPHRSQVTALAQLTSRHALWIGTAQIASLFPGVSRAGATIIGGLLAGLSRPAATQFSFYLALPTVAAASSFSLLKSLPELHAADAIPLSAGLIAAFVSALAVIRLFLVYIQSHDFRVFGYYRIFIGALLLLM